MWAIVTSKGEAIPVSKTERGAKNYATRNKYNLVCKISPYSMGCYALQEKKGGKWVTKL